MFAGSRAMEEAVLLGVPTAAAAQLDASFLGGDASLLVSPGDMEWPVCSCCGKAMAHAVRVSAEVLPTAADALILAGRPPQSPDVTPAVPATLPLGAASSQGAPSSSSAAKGTLGATPRPPAAAAAVVGAAVAAPGARSHPAFNADGVDVAAVLVYSCEASCGGAGCFSEWACVVPPV
ncbi:hypothetical protein FNF28_05486 [Cafeteria roenbergensis]|uniref:Uncharacterized protein n=1 Tax=Cafeteria roenbergensis TaxID=33653 RepID=A0A5A8D7P6_CAFRO|nr:hypothetical protein FNF28_05486 [Cafeteria roenbergensis]